MAENYCEPFPQCDIPEGRILLSPSFLGRPIVTKAETYALPWAQWRFALCPYVRVIYEQTWVSKEACLGPVRSVLGLAPGESIVTEVRQVEQVDYTSIVRRGFESTETTSFMRPAEEVAGIGSGARSTSDDSVERRFWSHLPGTIFFKPRVVFGWNLNLGGAIGAFIGGAVGGGLGALAGAFIGDAIGDFVGGGSGSSQTADGIDQSLASVTRTQTQYNATETSRTESTLTERSISRSFSNPYRDRSLDLRFIPVFRHYEVVTRIVRFEIGLSCAVVEGRFEPQFIAAKLGAIRDARLFDPRIRSLVEQELGEVPDLAIWNAMSKMREGLITEHLNANAEHYSRVVLAHLFRRGTPEVVLKHGISAVASAAGAAVQNVLQCLDYNSSYVVDNCLFLPVPEVDKLKTWPEFDPAILAKLKTVPPYVPPGGHPVPLPPTKRDVHIYIGTHIEAAPGQCVLTNLG